MVNADLNLYELCKSPSKLYQEEIVEYLIETDLKFLIVPCPFHAIISCCDHDTVYAMITVLIAKYKEIGISKEHLIMRISESTNVFTQEEIDELLRYT